MPNLGKGNGKGESYQEMKELLKYALQNIDRDLYMKLRGGDLSLL